MLAPMISSTFTGRVCFRAVSKGGTGAPPQFPDWLLMASIIKQSEFSGGHAPRPIPWGVCPVLWHSPCSNACIHTPVVYLSIKNSWERYMDGHRSSSFFFLAIQRKYCLFEMFKKTFCFILSRKFSSLGKEDHKVLFFGLEPLLSLSNTLCLKVGHCPINNPN